MKLLNSITHTLPLIFTFALRPCTALNRPAGQAIDQRPLVITLPQTLHKTNHLSECSIRVPKREVLATTTTPFGHVVDWVQKTSQGRIPRPPPGPKFWSQTGLHDSPMPTGTPALTDLESKDASRGPPGTVPFARSRVCSGLRTPASRLNYPQDASDMSTSPSAGMNAPASESSSHWYAVSGQDVHNYGGHGTFNVWDPLVENQDDFSLVQMWVTNRYGSFPARGSRGLPFVQTLEAGLISSPHRYGNTHSHLFTFFNTNGYKVAEHGPIWSEDGMGWDTDVQGWVQVDDTIYPGTAITTVSTTKGPQYDLWLAFHLYEDNWWLWVKDRWIGYYPGSIFRNGHAGLENGTLANQADNIQFGGEVFDSSTTPGKTATDMGSGEFANKKWQHAAYIHRIQYQPDPSLRSSASVDYDGNSGLSQRHPSRYQIEPHFRSRTQWASYVWLGGPGTDGNVSGHKLGWSQKVGNGSEQRNASVIQMCWIACLVLVVFLA